MRKKSWKFFFLFVCFLFSIFFFACSSSNRISASRFEQFPDSEIVLMQAAVRRLLESYRLASRESGVVDHYADLLRFYYQKASANGQSIDDGIRMLNLIGEIHFRNNGSKSLWKQVVYTAKSAGSGEDGAPLLPIPQKFK